MEMSLKRNEAEIDDAESKGSTTSCAKRQKPGSNNVTAVISPSREYFKKRRMDLIMKLVEPFILRQIKENSSTAENGDDIATTGATLAVPQGEAVAHVTSPVKDILSPHNDTFIGPRHWLDPQFSLPSVSCFAFQPPKKISTAPSLSKRGPRCQRTRCSAAARTSKIVEESLSRFISALRLGFSDTVLDTQQGNVSETKLDLIFNITRLRQNWNARTFHPFSRLPTELRLVIWQFYLPRERVLAMKRTRLMSEHHIPFTVHGFWAPNSVPTALHICRESRCEALRYYKLSFGTWDGQRLTYFDPNFDTVYIGNRDRHIEHSANSVLQFFVKDTNANMIVSLALGVRLVKALQRRLAEDALEENMISEAKRNVGSLRRVFRISDSDSLCEPDTLTGDLVIKKVPKTSQWRHPHRHRFLRQFFGVKIACATMSRKGVGAES